MVGAERRGAVLSGGWAHRRAADPWTLTMRAGPKERRERPEIVAELERDAITLFGPPVRELLAGNYR